MAADITSDTMEEMESEHTHSEYTQCEHITHSHIKNCKTCYEKK